MGSQNPPEGRAGSGFKPQLFLSGLLNGGRLPRPIFLVLCWEVWGRAHSAQLACLQVAPMRSSSTPSSGHWTGQGFCATRPSSCHSWKPRTTPATSTVSTRGVCPLTLGLELPTSRTSRDTEAGLLAAPWLGFPVLGSGGAAPPQVVGEDSKALMWQILARGLPAGRPSSMEPSVSHRVGTLPSCCRGLVPLRASAKHSQCPWLPAPLPERAV